LLSVLVFAAVGLFVVSIATAILIAAGKPLGPFAIVGPLLPLAAAGHLVLIPRFGAHGAALVTTLFAVIGALGTLLAVFRTWGVFPPLGTVCRSGLLAAAAYASAALWPTWGLLLLLKLLLIGLGIVVAFWVLGEWKIGERPLSRFSWNWRTRSRQPVAELSWNQNESTSQ
jgi:O-antigen/teichoic acid export membrane protein